MKHLMSAFVLMIVFGATSYSLACSCAFPSAIASKETLVKEEVDSWENVFVGKVVKVSNPTKSDGSPAERNYTEFEVIRSWKGSKKAKVTVRTSNGCCDCGMSFTIGKTYIVYADGRGTLTTNMCSRTEPLDSSGESEDEKYLGVPRIVKAK